MTTVIPFAKTPDDWRREIGLSMELKYRPVYQLTFLLPQAVVCEVFCFMRDRGLRFIAQKDGHPLDDDRLAIVAFQLLNQLHELYGERHTTPSLKDITTDVFSLLEQAGITLMFPKSVKF